MVTFSGTPKAFSTYASERSLATTGVSTLIGVNGSSAVIRGYAPIVHAGNHGCALNGTTNDVVALQAALDALSTAGGGVISTGGKSAKISGVLTIPSNVILDFGGGTLQLTNTTDGVKLSSSSLVQNITISATGVTSYVGPMLIIDDMDGYNRTVSHYCGGGPAVRLLGPGSGASAAGTALYIHGNGGVGITEILFHDLTIRNFDYGLHIHAETSWVNCSKIVVSLFGCKRHITLAGNSNPAVNEIAANEIAYRIQPNTDVTNSIYGIHCEGWKNHLSGSIFDWEQSGSVIGMEFTSTGQDNYVVEEVMDGEYLIEAAVDGQTSNDITLMSGRYRAPVQLPILPLTSETSAAIVDVHDCLAYANLRTGIAATFSGDAFTNSGAMFNPTANSATIASLTSAVVKIDLGATKNYLFSTGVLFGFGEIAPGVKIDASTDDVTYTTIINLTANSNYVVERSGQNFLGNYRYVRFTFTGSATAINVERIWACFADEKGKVWLNQSATDYRVPLYQLSTLAADNVLSDVATAQALFPTGQDEFLAASFTTYYYEAMFNVRRSAGTTSHTIALLLGGTATYQDIDLMAEVSNGDTGTIAAVTRKGIAVATAQTITAANTSANEQLCVKISGTITTSATGTIIPQIQYSAAPGGAMTVKRGSFARFWNEGGDTQTLYGSWS